MSSAVVAGASSSCSAAFTKSYSIKTSSTSSPKPLVPRCLQKASFQGLFLLDAKRGFSSSFIADKRSRFRIPRRRLEITARTASKNIEVEVDKPLGLTLGQKSGGGVVIAAVEGGGNAAKAGLKAGDQVLYTSSFFGDELWPADKLGFTKTAIQAKPDSVYFVVSRGVEPDEYACPQCRAPKKRFAPYDVSTGKAIGGGLPPIGVIIGLVAGLGGVAALLAYGFSSSANLSYMYILQQYSYGSWMFTYVIAILLYCGSCYCYLVWPRVFAGAAMLSLATVMLNIVYYLVLYLAKNKTDTSRVGPAAAAPNQAGIALGQAQFPPPSTQAPVFVYEDTYMRRQFPSICLG
ncbi:hypothetical protein RHMOL_Rhmol09G0273700 [Rhododendron molle]|uniref:Uncharacterized protein n=1 Tax=Rhododendron molle TaxID=49168 RepID=A0ACC0MHP6_RHOML|nr:hypothetical protein RHMOL_Rhmol09G0273700 [Rhododendron molle]